MGKPGRTGGLLHTLMALKSSDMFAIYTAKTHRVTQSCNDNNNVGNLSACVCLLNICYTKSIFVGLL